MGAFSNQLPLVQDQDVVGVDDGRHPVGNGNDRTSPVDFPECFKYELLTSSIKVRRRFIEEKDPRPSHQSSSETQTFPFTSGQVLPSLAQWDVQ